MGNGETLPLPFPFLLYVFIPDSDMKFCWVLERVDPNSVGWFYIVLADVEYMILCTIRGWWPVTV